jgi:hypothetical protein
MENSRKINKIMNAMNLLISYGFTQTGPNTFKKYTYKAVIWDSGAVTITKYTPNAGRFLFEHTYDNTELLRAELIKLVGGSTL